jgi:hypothetical protein
VYLVLELSVCDAAKILGMVAFPEDCDLVAPTGLNMSIDTVVRGVELAAGEPGDVSVLEVAREDPLLGANRLEVLEPGEIRTGLISPEFVRILN